MKKALLIALALVATVGPVGSAQGGPLTYNVLLAGGGESNTMRISLSEDGDSYVIDSSAPLEVGGDVCENPLGNSNELICQAVRVSAFEVNAAGGEDFVRVSRHIKVPTILRGGTGRDTLIGGSGPDKLIGGEGPDKLIGRDNDDTINGGEGYDALIGGAGDDRLHGGPDPDTLYGGSGDNKLFQN